jgi:branched-chain amino acid transport system permease protein
MNPVYKILFLLLLLLALAIFPLGAPELFSEYYVDLLTKILIFGMVLLGFDILAGYTGLVSLGHAMFFGMGGYCAALLMNTLSTNLLPSLIFAFLCAMVVGLLVGYFSTQTKDIFFVFLTLAFAQLLYLVIFNMTTLTGGDDGVVVPNAILGIPGFWEIEITRPVGFYYFVLVFFVLTYLLCKRIITSPFGRVLIGIRENEERISYLGYNVRRLKIKSYLISVIIASMAGVLFAAYQNFASPEMLHWTISGDFILMSVLGGMGTLIGPVLGGAIIIWVGDFLSSLTENWMIFIGGFFVLTIIFAPKGIVGLITQRKKKK